jgi:hypothetical protein
MRKGLTSHGDPDWGRVRPPLCALDAARAGSVLAVRRDVGFTMPGYPGRSPADYGARGVT